MLAQKYKKRIEGVGVPDEFLWNEFKLSLQKIE
jgi:hypothetical protein